LQASPIPSQSRNITDVGSHAQPLGCSSTPHSNMGFPTLPPLQQSSLGGYQLSQTPVLLGGGVVDTHENQAPSVSPAHTMDTSWNMYKARLELDAIHQSFSWMPLDPAHPIWLTPISSGEWYQYFLASLDRQQFDAFCYYFGQNWGANTPEAASFRKIFYQDLYPYPQNAFRRIIDECRAGLPGAPSVARPPTTQGTLATPSYSQPRPVVMILHMLSATIPIARIAPNFLPSPNAARSTSAPELVLQQNSRFSR
jgi:hypothetical protein